MTFLAWVILLLLSSWIHTEVESVSCNNTIYFGVSLSRGPEVSSAELAFVGAETSRSLEFWKSEYFDKKKRFISVQNLNYTIELIILDDFGNKSLMLQNYKTLIDEYKPCLFLLAPCLSEFGIAARKFVESQGFGMLGISTSSNEFFQGASWSLSVSTAASAIYDISYPYFRIVGARTAVSLTENSTFPLQSLAGVEVKLPQNNINLISKTIIKSSLSSLDAETKTLIENVITNYTIIKPDILFLLTYSVAHKYAMKFMKKIDWAPKAIIYAAIDTSNLQGDLGMYVLAVGSDGLVDKTYPADVWYGNYTTFKAQYTNRTNHPVVSITTLSVFAPILLTEAIIASQSLDQAVVFTKLVGMQFNTFSGTIQWLGDKSNIGQVNVLVQNIDGNLTTIGPSMTAQAAIVYPFVRWSEREFRQIFGSPAEYVIICLACLSALVSVGFFIFLVLHITHPVVRGSSPLFMFLIILGSLLCYVSIFFWLPNAVSTSSCHLKYWLLGLGFSLLYGSLFAKSWRIYRLMSNSTVNVLPIKNSIILSIVGALIVIQMVILALWSILGKSKTHIVEVDKYRKVKNYYDCSSDTKSFVIGWILLIWNLLVLVYGSFLATRLRKISYRTFNESKSIGYSMYNLGIIAFVVSILELTHATDRIPLFIIRSLGILFGAGFTVAFLWIQKLKLVRNATDSFDSKKTKLDSKTVVINPNSALEEDYKILYEQVTKENSILRARILNLENELAKYYN